MDGHIITFRRGNSEQVLAILQESFPASRFVCRTTSSEAVIKVFQVHCMDHDLIGWNSNNNDKIEMMQCLAQTVLAELTNEEH